MSIAVTIVVFVIADVDYDTYNKGAVYLSWFLQPALKSVSCHSIIGEQIELLKNIGKQF